MKTIAIDYGHNSRPDTGCNGLSPEYPREDELVKAIAEELHERLWAEGFKTVNCHPGKVSSVSESLRKRIAKANAADADYFISIHMNCFNKRAYGTEQFATSPAGKRLANAIQEELVKLGFANRGVKEGGHLFVVRETAMPAVLVEVCFCDSKHDMHLFDKDKVVDAIMKAITSTL
jgi:N-acetylmuramoyl-L-alanine amidase